MNKFYSEPLTQADLIVGVFTKNQTDTLPFVLSEIAKGLQNYFPDFISAIVHIDSNPQEETRAAFLNSTGIPKILISTQEKLGRGEQVFLLFKEMQRLRAQAAVIVDSSSGGVTPEWLRELATPILYGYDFVSPIYSRVEPEDNIGSNICYPLIYGLLGKDIRYPIGGDVAVSLELAQYYLSQNWTAAVKNHGVDIFMTLHALLGKFESCQAALGAKLKHSAQDHVSLRFQQTVEVLFEELLANKDHWLPPTDVKDFRIFGELKFEDYRNSFHVNGFANEAINQFNYSRDMLATVFNQNLFASLCKMYDQQLLAIDSHLWVQILYEALYQYDKTHLGGRLIKGLEALYFGRLLTLLKELQQEEGVLEKVLKKQAESFYKFRNLLTQKYEYQLAVA